MICILQSYVNSLVFIVLAATDLDDWYEGSPNVLGITNKSLFLKNAVDFSQQIGSFRVILGNDHHIDIRLV